MISALLIHGVPIECINRAAITYRVPAKIIVSIIETEGGSIGSANKNHNGTVDYGVMQINSIWLPKIEHYGYTQQEIQYDPCANVAVAAWILNQNISKANNGLEGIGEYHSHTKPLLCKYENKFITNYQNLTRILG